MVVEEFSLIKAKDDLLALHYFAGGVPTSSAFNFRLGPTRHFSIRFLGGRPAELSSGDMFYWLNVLLRGIVELSMNGSTQHPLRASANPEEDQSAIVLRPHAEASCRSLHQKKGKKHSRNARKIAKPWNQVTQ
jgi:hypothetical protein